MLFRSLRLSIRCVMFLLAPLVAGCGSAGDRPVVVSGNQGSFAVQHEKNPMDSRPRQAGTAAEPLGPTARELEQQQRIEELEGKQRALQAEIDRLKDEKAKGK